MSENSKYNSLIRQKSNARAQYSSCEQRIEKCEYLLNRLKSAKEQIADQKSKFKEIKKSDEKISKEKGEWQGATYNSYEKKMDSLVQSNEHYYKSHLDRILDSINDEITRIENKKMEEYGLLGKLGSWINSLSNEIENFFN